MAEPTQDLRTSESCLTGGFSASSSGVTRRLRGRSFTFASAEELAGLYRGAGVTPDRQVITYCGRGYAGACGLLALKLLGYERVRLYNGSWAEWSADPRLPVEVRLS